MASYIVTLKDYIEDRGTLTILKDMQSRLDGISKLTACSLVEESTSAGIVNVLF